MNKNYPTVTIGCPVRDRELYLPSYLECIKNLDYPLENITLLFIENDSKDSTLSILNKFKNENNHLFHRIKIYTYNQGTPPDERDSYIREQFSYNALSRLRNYWLQQIKTSYALSCDSDIMMPKNTLKQLLSHKQDYVAGLIVNGYLFDKSNPYKYLNILKKVNGGYTHINQYPENTLLEVDFSGAIMLLSQKSCKLGHFGFDKQGEDLVMCQTLQSKGIKIYVDTSIRCTHCMSEEYLELYKKGEFVF